MRQYDAMRIAEAEPSSVTVDTDNSFTERVTRVEKIYPSPKPAPHRIRTTIQVAVTNGEKGESWYPLPEDHKITSGAEVRLTKVTETYPGGGENISHNVELA